MHETSKRLSQTLKDVYESDWQGVEDLSVITEVRTRHCAHDFSAILTVLKCVCFASGSQSEDLLWNDYEEKLSDQVVRTMENYTSQFPEVKVRISLQH